MGISDEKINCFVCEKELDNWVYESKIPGKMIEVHPMGGLHFQTHGHYGSRIFDPMGTGETLDIAICDTCVMKNLDKVRGDGKRELVEDFEEFMSELK